MRRPAVDVVFPFVGDLASLDAVRDRLDALERRPGDSCSVVNNRPLAFPPPAGVLRATTEPTLAAYAQARA